MNLTTSKTLLFPNDFLQSTNISKCIYIRVCMYIQIWHIINHIMIPQYWANYIFLHRIIWKFCLHFIISLLMLLSPLPLLASAPLRMYVCTCTWPFGSRAKQSSLIIFYSSISIFLCVRVFETDIYHLNI